MGPEIAYLIGGSVILVLLTIADLPRFKSRRRRRRAVPQTGAEITAQAVRTVHFGEFKLHRGEPQSAATSGSVSLEEAFQSFQTPSPGVAPRREFKT
jgi:hypothetical protein